jgi:anti-sigma factor RsiW
MITDELTCQELVEIVTDYLEGALSAEERARFEAHLADCPGCRNYMAQIQTTIRVSGLLSEETIPPAARDGLLYRFRSWKKKA